MGSLGTVWTDCIFFMDDRNEFSGQFQRVFGHAPHEVLLGAEQPWAYHQTWSAFLSLLDLQEYSGPILADLKNDLKDCRVYNLITG